MAGQAACGHQGAGSGTAPASTWGPNEQRPLPLHAGPNSRCWQPEQALPKTTVSGASIRVKCSFVPPSCGEMSLITSRMVLDTAYLETDGTEGQPRLGWFGGGAVAANCGGDDCWRATPLDCQWLSVDDSSGWVAFWSAPRNAERRAPQSGQSARGRDFRSWPRSIHHMEHAGTTLTRQSAGIRHAGRLHLAHWHTAGGCRDALSAPVGPARLIKKLDPKARSAAPSRAWFCSEQEEKKRKEREKTGGTTTCPRSAGQGPAVLCRGSQSRMGADWCIERGIDARPASERSTSAGQARTESSPQLECCLAGQEARQNC